MASSFLSLCCWAVLLVYCLGTNTHILVSADPELVKEVKEITEMNIDIETVEDMEEVIEVINGMRRAMRGNGGAGGMKGGSRKEGGFRRGPKQSPPARCADQAPADACMTYKGSGYCFGSFLIQNKSIDSYWCPRTCGSCGTLDSPPPSPPESYWTQPVAPPCEDRSATGVNCKKWNSLGYCSTTYPYTYLGESVPFVVCRATCALCDMASPPPQPQMDPPGVCVDDPSINASYCGAWKERGYCSRRFTYNGQSVASVWCRSTCGSCGRPGAMRPAPMVDNSPPLSGPPTLMCSDAESTASNCAFWKMRGYCGLRFTYNDSSVAEVWCRATCGVCNKPASPPMIKNSPPPAGGSHCSDDESTASSCGFWKMRGYCGSNFIYKGSYVGETWCRATCGTCDQPPSMSPPPRPSAPCVDRLALTQLCINWKVEGICDPKYYTLGQSVRDYWCRATCDACSEADPDALMGLAPSPITMAPSPLVMAPSPLVMAPSPLVMAPSPLAMAPSPLAMTPSPLATPPSPVKMSPPLIVSSPNKTQGLIPPPPAEVAGGEPRVYVCHRGDTTRTAAWGTVLERHDIENVGFNSEKIKAQCRSDCDAYGDMCEGFTVQSTSRCTLYSKVSGFSTVLPTKYYDSCRVNAN